MKIPDKDTEELINEIKEAVDLINKRLPELIGRKQYFYFKTIPIARLDISPALSIYFERMEHKEVFKSKNNTEQHGN